jgi:hypothetical protein
MEKERPRLVRVGDGYLLSAGELLYLPCDPTKPEWRFGLSWEDEQRHGWTGVQAASFGVPRVVDDRIVVAGYRGGVYVFDISSIVGGQRNR